MKALFKALNAVSRISPNHARHDFSIFLSVVGLSDIICLCQFFSKQIETPKDVQEKFGRTVVETYLL